MKPRNFPDRRLRRQARANERAGVDLTPEQLAACRRPKDIRIRRVFKHPPA